MASCDYGEHLTTRCARCNGEVQSDFILQRGDYFHRACWELRAIGLYLEKAGGVPAHMVGVLIGGVHDDH